MKRSEHLRIFFLACFSLLLLSTGHNVQAGSRISSLFQSFLSPSKLSSKEDLDLDRQGGGSYTFRYADKEYEADFDTDTWTIYNSYQIKNSRDILLICEALSEEHPVPSRDGESSRTPKDMAFEWEQHNLAYDQLPKGGYWSDSSKNVDLDPDDQGKTFKEIYEDRTGKKLDFDTLMEKKDKIEEKAREKLEEKGIDLDDLDTEKIKKKLDTEKIREKLDSEDIGEKFESFKEKLKEKIKEFLKSEDE